MEKFYEKYMFIIGGCGSLVFYLQAIKVFYSKDATAVSLTAFLVGLVSVISWAVYGFIIKNRVLFVSNVISTVGALLVVIGIIHYHV